MIHKRNRDLERFWRRVIIYDALDFEWDGESWCRCLNCEYNEEYHRFRHDDNDGSSESSTSSSSLEYEHGPDTV